MMQRKMILMKMRNKFQRRITERIVQLNKEANERSLKISELLNKPNRTRPEMEELESLQRVNRRDEHVIKELRNLLQ